MSAVTPQQVLQVWKREHGMWDESIHTTGLMFITHGVSYTIAHIQQENHLVMLTMILSGGLFSPQL